MRLTELQLADRQLAAYEPVARPTEKTEMTMTGAGPNHERDQVTQPEWWLYLWRTNHSSQARRAIVTAVSAHRNERTGYTVDAHPSSTALAKVLTELDNIHTVVTERALTPTELIEVIENLSWVIEWNHSMTFRGWHPDGGRIWAHPNLQVAAATMDAAERDLREFKELLLTEHGEYEPDEESFPPLKPLMGLLETAYGAGDMTDPQLSEVATWLAEIAHIAVAILACLAGRSDSNNEAFWQAAIKATEVYLALCECTLPQHPAEPGKPQTRPTADTAKVSRRPAVVTIHNKDLLLMQDSTVQIVPEQLSNAMLHAGSRGMPLLMVTLQCLTPTDGQHVVTALLAGAPHLGYLVGLIEARIAEVDKTAPGTAAQYIAAKDQASGAARHIPPRVRINDEQ
jgi:hypothetical protein